MPSTLRRLRLLWPLLAALSACSPPAPPPPPPAPAPAPTPSVPGTAVPPAPAASGPLADPERDAVLFTHWRAEHAAEVDAFEEFLVREKVAQVVPTYQLLRSASMWKECRAEPFDLPPATEWPHVRDLLVLLQHLRARGVLPQFEVVSAYRNPRLNRCAGGAAGSSHQRFAVDLAPLTREEGERLCSFWRREGKAWAMGVSRYPSGRIHVDRTGYRTWGATHKRASSFCLG